MKNYSEAQAKQILKTFYPQIESIMTMDDKKSFVFQCKIKSSLFLSGEFFKTIGINPGSHTVLLEIVNEKLHQLEILLNSEQDGRH